MAREHLILTAWKQNKLWPSLLMVLLLANIALFVAETQVIAPKVTRLEEQLIKNQAEARLVRQQGANAATPENTLARGRQELQSFREAIPDKESFSELIGDISILASRADLEIDQITYAPEEKPEENLLIYSLSFTVSGSYRQLKKFIHSLEHSPRLIVIHELSLSGSSEKQQESVRMQIRLSTYFTSEGAR
ncbi:type 4a pilus biogenesis protein PilO [Desulfuromonas sp. AOP6]|uniref:type 4a pilus biogenesis protein PilO n=1 Tax=Desulfuromonas sp. AOP6 TaxID=1566351 RepID=UPI0012773A54|nr:type 4a pilus biogenesis protein PilO [Desulfuromonas sp. AOP6]BCA80175.1 hypothetical protein AOP6_1962 [Desulfuromonas sp. AOP6]